MERRRGTFRALDHVHEGYRLDGALTDSARPNQTLLDRRWPESAQSSNSDRPVGNDLAALDYDIVSRRNIPDPNPER